VVNRHNLIEQFLGLWRAWMPHGMECQAATADLQVSGVTGQFVPVEGR
jgi:hypothetical protein